MLYVCSTAAECGYDRGMPKRSADLTGTVTRWEDDRGFGFITLTGGSERFFFHISSYLSAGRPEQGETVTFVRSSGKDGRPAAVRVRGAGKAAAEIQRAAGVGSLAPVVLLVAAYFIADQVWFLPEWLPWLYIGASIVTFLVYGLDKLSARTGGERISENVLLFLGLVGGWPGAIIAQLAFRHKTVKRSFRDAFWATVALNIAAVVVVVWLGLST